MALAIKVSLTLGVVGGAMGLLVSSFVSFRQQDFVALSCRCEAVSLLSIALLPAIMGAILGILGAIVSSFHQKEGGILLLLSGSLIAAGWLFPMSQIVLNGSALADQIALGLVLTDFLWWNAITLLAGLIAFPRTRKALRQLRREGWLP